MTLQGSLISLSDPQRLANKQSFPIKPELLSITDSVQWKLPNQRHEFQSVCICRLDLLRYGELLWTFKRRSSVNQTQKTTAYSTQSRRLIQRQT
jgi:hypothetical protein